MTPLTELAAAYERDGYAIAPGALSQSRCIALCERLSAIIVRDAERCLADRRIDLSFFARFVDSSDQALAFFDDARGDLRALPVGAWESRVMRVGHALHAADEAFAALLSDPNVGVVSRALMGDAAHVLTSAVIYKQPRSDNVQFGLHQDSWYLTTDPPSLHLAFIALDDMDEARGCLEMVPGSHREPWGEPLTLGPSGFVPVRRPEAANLPGRRGNDLSREAFAGRVATLPMKRGDVAFVDGRTLHASGPNRTELPRRALVIHAALASSRLSPSSWLRTPQEGFAKLGGE